jgi:XTP/dITP diphosphohydrolase
MSTCLPTAHDPLSAALYVASSNPGKLRDFAVAAGRYGIGIAPLPGLAEIPAPPEAEPTFEGNACAKAVYYSRRAPGLLVLADDSGLEVDALGGMPGVRSARYADDAGFTPDAALPPDARNNLCLLAALRKTAAPRTGRYQCVLALARNGEVLGTAEGAVEGEILDAPRGAGGFGYDPLFLIPSLDRTMAELEAATRLSLSHRGRALQAMLSSQSPLFAHDLR